MGFPLLSFFFRKSNNRSSSEAQSTGSNSPLVSIRLAVYDNFTSEPRIIDMENGDAGDLIARVSERVHAECKKNGGRIPFAVIREVVENLIHADFRDSVISISPDGCEISVSDHGPGIVDKKSAFLPGYTTATLQHRKYIRGVGSGLPIAKETIEVLGGSITVDDNLGTGSVVTITWPANQESDKEGQIQSSAAASSQASVEAASAKSTEVRRKAAGAESTTKDHKRSAVSTEAAREIIRNSLSERQRKLMILTAEFGEIGPSIPSKELDMSLSTVYRDLVALEELHLLQSVEGGKRRLTDQGIEVLSLLMD